MTASRFKKLYPDIPRNTNCLRDMACFQCGNRESFSIIAKSNFIIFDDGTSEFGDVEYEADALMACRGCGKTGILNDFIIARLDD